MDWKSLSAAMPPLKGYPARTARIAALNNVLTGTLYDHLQHSFDTEATGVGGEEYVPLTMRRPSVRSGLCRTVTDDSVALLFAEGRFPVIHSQDAATLDGIAAVVKVRRLNEVMLDAATKGSVGSVAILFRVLSEKPFFDVMQSTFLTPVWRKDDPDTLAKVVEKYKVVGTDLIASGYTGISEPTAYYWFSREWTDTNETWFVPWPVNGDVSVPTVDTERSVNHGLGFVPVVWVQNLPGGDGIDGPCTFEAAIDTVIEVDYLLSQAGRALKYAGDPKLVVNTANGESKGLGGGSGNAIMIQGDGDAKLLEINGTAATASLEHVRYLRALALESAHGNRADADKLSAAQSGRAMELMNQGLIWLADKLRVSYGEGALLTLARMVCEASLKVPNGLLVGSKRLKNLKPEDLSLVWPRWYAPTATDRQSEATTLNVLVEAGLMSRETAVRTLSSTYDIEDVDAELLLIAANEAAADARAAALPAAQSKITDNLPA